MHKNKTVFALESVFYLSWFLFSSHFPTNEVISKCYNWFTARRRKKNNTDEHTVCGQVAMLFQFSRTNTARIETKPNKFKWHLSWACWKMDSIAFLMMEMEWNDIEWVEKCVCVCGGRQQAKVWVRKWAKEIESEWLWLQHWLKALLSETHLKSWFCSRRTPPPASATTTKCDNNVHDVTRKTNLCVQLCVFVSTIKNNVHFPWNIVY